MTTAPARPDVPQHTSDTVEHAAATPDLRILTINDFHDFCKEKGYRIHRQVALDTENGLIVEDDPNLNADVAIVVLSKS